MLRGDKDGFVFFCEVAYDQLKATASNRKSIGERERGRERE